MGQFIFGMLAGIIVGLVMEWVIDWTGLLPKKSTARSQTQTKARATDDSKVIREDESVQDIASSPTKSETGGE